MGQTFSHFVYGDSPRSVTNSKIIQEIYLFCGILVSCITKEEGINYVSFAMADETYYMWLIFKGQWPNIE